VPRLGSLVKDTYRGLTLDLFQKQAMDAIAHGENVVVAAPTGSGKTLIAHYAIDQALAAGERVIYTAPIKALSNQKYRDLSEKHPGKVGISTGDLSIDSNAQVVVMTTEIFRNTIFEDPERAAKVGWVIFDEVHYLDDPDRGTVWEESLIFAPHNVRVLALSATVSNLEEFTDWLREVRDHPVRVVLETTRPVPLDVLVASTEGDTAPVNRTEKLKVGSRGFRAKFNRRSSDLRGYYERAQERLVRLVRDNNELPLLFFLFSRKACERLALAIGVEDDLSVSWEQGQAGRAEFDRLAKAFDLDLEDPDIRMMGRLAERGVAYHHAGILPALKEVVERLFGAGYIRLLCATETFALGVNMPARAVAFESIVRWNGKARVPLMTRQYQQMAGRAGRRGIDDRGAVYVTFDPFRDDPRTLKGMVSGNVEPVRSQFNLSYGTLLNLYERLGDDLFEACERSFANFRARRRGAKAAAKAEGKGGVVRGRAGRSTSNGSSVYELAVEGEREGRGGRRGKRDRGRRGKRDRGRGRGRRGRRERDEARGKGGGRRSDPYEGIVEQVRRKMAVLSELGYLDAKGKITERGRFAKQVFGHELELSELVFGDAFKDLRPGQIAVVAAAVVFESRKRVFYGGDDARRIVGKQSYRLSDKAVGGLVRLEETRGIRQPCKLLDWNLSGCVSAWVEGAEFAQLKELSDASDGDVVRSLRQTIQLLRLAQGPLRDRGQHALAERFGTAQRLLKRDQVDAEWQLRRAAELAGLDPQKIDEEVAGDAGIDSEGVAESPDTPESGDAPESPDTPEPPSVDEFSAGLL
jgi:superfamily II RNA helicase